MANTEIADSQLQIADCRLQIAVAMFMPVCAAQPQGMPQEYSA